MPRITKAVRQMPAITIGVILNRMPVVNREAPRRPTQIKEASTNIPLGRRKRRRL
jgi:hypothetical protein